MLALVRHRQPVAGIAGRLPARRELGAHPLDGGVLFAGRARRVEPVDQQARDALLLAQQGAAGGLGGVRGQHRLDAESPEQPDHVTQRQALRREAREALLEPAGLRGAAVVHVLAAPAHPVHLLRQVDHLEPRRERADQVERLLGRPVPGAHHHLDRGLRLALAAADGGVAITLHRLEQRLAALVLEDVAHELAQRVHVVAQRRVLERKEDAFAGHGRGWRAKSLGCWSRRVAGQMLPDRV